MNAPKTDKPSRRRTALVASLALAGSLLAVPYIAQAASLDDPAPAPVQESPAALLSEQISKAANDLYDTAHKDPATGYSNIVVSAKDGGYTLYWKGAVPQAVLNLVDAHRTQGLRASVQDAGYTRTELEAKAQSIAQPGANVGGDVITSVGPSSDGNALDISVAPSSFVVPGSQQELDALEGARSALTSRTGGIPVNISAKDGGDPTVMVPKNPDLTRYEASGYLPGGYGIGSPNYCTTGFTVIDPFHNVNYITTAAHCVNRIGETVKNGNKDKVIGKVVDIQAFNDSALIALDPGVLVAAPSVYSGYGLAGPHGLSRNVGPASRTFVGEVLCTDGALMGEQCGGKVTAVGSWEWDKKNKVYRLLDKLSQVAGRNMAGSGDSGGPVYAGRTGSTSASYTPSPRGVISMTFAGDKCFNPIPGMGNTRSSCSSEIGVTNLVNSMLLHSKALNIPLLRVDTGS